MSGVEIIGIVLGSLSVAISGLEHYRKTTEAIKLVKHAAKEFWTVAMKLDAEDKVFQNTLVILLQDSVLDLRTQRALLKDVGGGAWREPRVTRALQQRLGSSFRSYLDQVRYINDTLGELIAKLEIDGDGKGPFDDPRSFRQAYSRIRFALKRAPYLKLVKEVRDHNTLLDRLTKQTRALQVGRRARRLPNYDRVRLGAISVHDVLYEVLHRTCGVSHRASICLRSVLEDMIDDSDDERDDSFRVLLHHVDTVSTDVPIWSLAETEIRTIITTPEADTVVTVVREMSSGSAAASKKAVRFDSDAMRSTVSRYLERSQASVSSSRDPATPSRPNLARQVEAEIEVMDLCQAIQERSMDLADVMIDSEPASSGSANADTIGYITSSARSDRHEISIPRQQLTYVETAVCSIHTLDAVLQSRYRPNFRMTDADIHRLSASLSAGMLRLHDTPWMQSCWNRLDISIVQRNDRLDAVHPFLSCGFGASAQRSVDVGNDRNDGTIRNRVLFSLGVLLIELCMRQPIDKLHLLSELDEHGHPHADSSYQTARRLLESGDIIERFGFRYNEVVSRCIHCSLDQSRPSLSDLAFKTAVYNDIVRELEEGCRIFLRG